MLAKSIPDIGPYGWSNAFSVAVTLLVFDALAVLLAVEGRVALRDGDACPEVLVADRLRYDWERKWDRKLRHQQPKLFTSRKCRDFYFISGFKFQCNVSINGELFQGANDNTISSVNAFYLGHFESAFITKIGDGPVENMSSRWYEFSW